MRLDKMPKTLRDAVESTYKATELVDGIPLVFQIPGIIPSKKNSRINTKSGKSFPSARYQDWHTKAMTVIGSTGAPLAGPVCIAIRFDMEDLRVHDLSNMAESVMDLLVDARVIKDDRWTVVPKLTLSGRLNKERPGCEIRITKGDVVCQKCN